MIGIANCGQCDTEAFRKNQLTASRSYKITFLGINLLIEQQRKQFHALDQWFKTPLGLSVAKECTQQLLLVKECLGGETLLQLGHCGDNPWLEILNFNHHWIASPLLVKNSTHLSCSFSQLPLDRNSVDCVIAPLALEPFNQGNRLLDEIDRILKPMGYVIFLSINPWSLWGAAITCGLLRCFAERNIKLRTPFKLNRLFLQRGYRQCSLTHFCYVLPINRERILQKLTFMDEIGKILWPFPSGLYCYIAQKYQPAAPSLLLKPIPKIAIKSSFQPLTN